MAHDKLLDFDFYADYALSSTGECKTCHRNIREGNLRIARLVQASFFDGKMKFFHHPRCFFTQGRNHPENENQVQSFYGLRNEDQDYIRENICKLNGEKYTGPKSHLKKKTDKSAEVVKKGKASKKPKEPKPVKVAKKKKEKPVKEEKKDKISKPIFRTRSERATVRSNRRKTDVEVPVDETDQPGKKKVNRRRKTEAPEVNDKSPTKKPKIEDDNEIVIDTEMVKEEDADSIVEISVKGKKGKKSKPVSKTATSRSKRAVSKPKSYTEEFYGDEDPVDEDVSNKSDDEDKTVDDCGEADLPENERQYRQRNDIFWKNRDAAEREFTKKQWLELLAFNDWGDAKHPKPRFRLHNIGEMLTYGVPEKCPKCKSQNGWLFPSNAGFYFCVGTPDAWTTCDYRTPSPARRAMQIPEKFADRKLMKKYKYVERDRLFSPTLITYMKKVKEEAANALKPEEIEQKKVEIMNNELEKELSPGKPLEGLVVYAFGLQSMSKTQMQELIESLGGTCSPRYGNTVTLCVTQNGMNMATVNKIKANKIPIVSQVFIMSLPDIEVKTGKELAELFSQHKMDTWGEDVLTRRARLATESIIAKQSDLMTKRQQQIESNDRNFKKDLTDSKLIFKKGAALDPEIVNRHGLDDVHVYRDENGKRWSVILALADVNSGINSYYKLSFLKHDTLESRYWVFRAWGRTGTRLGDSKMYDYYSFEVALKQMTKLFKGRTGNDWLTYINDPTKFEKQPRLMYPVDMDYGGGEGGKTVDEADHFNNMDNSGDRSGLAVPVKDLLRNIFDVEAMAAAMREFEIDLQRMPLGKLSRRQILLGYEVLQELTVLLEQANDSNSHLIRGKSSKFYTVIPHDFGIHTPPLLDSNDKIKEKMNMLESLLEMEVAFSMVKDSKEKVEANPERDPLDVQYESLKCDIAVVDETTDEYAMIKKYVESTHGSTHTHYKLGIEQVFKINRSEEDQKFKKELGNRKLLWHGSRLTNYAGILSKGLRIAPKEAPVTGYMFGKGVYFADMVTKSANYCFHHASDNMGYLLLSDVALGTIEERLQCDTELPKTLKKGNDSVKGVGKQFPNPDEATTIDFEGDVEIPFGRPIKERGSRKEKRELEYNEYIVYNTQQIRLRYLIQAKFQTSYALYN